MNWLGAWPLPSRYVLFSTLVLHHLWLMLIWYSARWWLKDKMKTYHVSPALNRHTLKDCSLDGVTIYNKTKQIWNILANKQPMSDIIAFESKAVKVFGDDFLASGKRNHVSQKWIRIPIRSHTHSPSLGPFVGACQRTTQENMYLAEWHEY